METEKGIFTALTKYKFNIIIEDDENQVKI